MGIQLLYQKMIQGGFYYYGNALGLTKDPSDNIPGTGSVQGAFITTDTTVAAVGGWPNGTTLNWEEGNSACYVEIPAGNEIDEAFLIWGANYTTTGLNLGPAIRTYPIYLITPDNVKHIITPVTTLTGSGFYSSSADVTSIVSGFTSGNFICGSIPCAVTASATQGQGGGWVLAIATKSQSGGYNYVTLSLSNDNYGQIGTNIPIVTPSSGTVRGTLMNAVIRASAVRGDALILQDTRPFSAPYRPQGNFFNSIISNNSGDGTPYTNASFGNNNNDPITATNIVNGRFGLDLAIYETVGDISPGASTYYLDGYDGGIAIDPPEGFTDYIAYGTALNPSNADTTLEKSVDKEEAQYGDEIVYTLSVILDGSGTVGDLNIYDTIPDNTTFVPGSIFLNGVNLPGADLETGINLDSSAALPYTATVTYRAQIDNGGSFENVSNSFYITFTNTISTGEAFTNTIVSNFVLTTIISSAQINMVKTVDKEYGSIGEILTYTITLNNSGNLNADTATFIDTLPSDVILEPNTLLVDGVLNPSLANPINIDLSPFNSLDVKTITYQVTVVDTIPAVNPIENSALINYSYNNNGVINTADISNIVMTTIAYGSLTAEKEVDKIAVEVGDIVTYTIPIKYFVGNRELLDVILIDTLPTEVTIVPNSLMVDGSIVSGSLESPGINIGTLLVGDISTVTFQVQVDTVPAINPIENSGYVKYSYVENPSESLKNGDINTNLVNTEVIDNNISIIKIVDKEFATIEDIITYTIVIPNNGNVAIENVIFYDTIPNDVMFINGSLEINGVPTAGTPNTISIGTIGIGEVTTIQYKVKI